MADNVILVGLMGCGKTTVGKLLAQRLGYVFVDTDNFVEERESMTIPDIFSIKGEPYFREIESSTIKLLCGQRQQVISTGGGAVKTQQNIDIMNSCGKTFYLEASAEVLYDRIKGDMNRPLLLVEDPLDRLKILLAERSDKYRQAQYTVDVENKTPDAIVDEIVAKL